MKIPVDLIDLADTISRRPISPAAMVRLESRIAADPANHKPIVVRPEGGRYRLVSGRRALLAARSVGFTDIEARIKEGKKRGTSE